MTGFQGRRLPIDPVLELVLSRYGVADETGTLHIDDTAAAVVLNVNSDSLGRWRRRGWIADRQADIVAGELGYHASELWPEEWFAGIDVDTP